MDGANHAVGGMVDVTADDAVGIIPSGNFCERLLKLADEVNGSFDPVFEKCR